MTDRQRWAITRIKKDVERCLTEYKELKAWEVRENEYFVSVVFEMGFVGDEGTLSEYLLRLRGQVFVGKRGGITYPMWNHAKNTMYRKRYRSALGVCIDQKKD